MVLGNGIYTLTEAGRLAGVSDAAARAWFKGWPKSKSGPVLHSDYADLSSAKELVSFLDFTDLLIVAGLRRLTSMPSIRRAYEALKPILDSEHPFSRSELYADDAGALFRRAADDAGDEMLIEVLRSQHAFPSILLPFLERLDYDPDTHLARSYTIEDGIVLDARRKYGKPITYESAMPTTILARAYKANEQDAEAVADWYGVTVDEVRRAVEFERRMAA